jgi:HEAT repeat protein
MNNAPRASDCGPLLKVVVRLKRTAVPSLVQALAYASPDIRAWAAYVLCEMPQPEGVTPLVRLIGDPDVTVSACAVLALKAASRTMPEAVRGALADRIRAPLAADRRSAARALGQLRDPQAVPVLVATLGDEDESVMATANLALVEITRQDFGNDAHPWLRWYEANQSRHRIEWLIDALAHDVAEVRRAAGDELRVVTREYFGYASELPQRDRERAQQRYRDWWTLEGKARFRTG